MKTSEKTMENLINYKRSALDIAEELLGCKLTKRLHDGSLIEGIICETEAYLGEEDLASHARFGKTKRNAPMYEDGGMWYVYTCYGIHAMLNIVTGEQNAPAAVLIRGVFGVKGPGRLSKHFGISMNDNWSTCSPNSGLWISKTNKPPGKISKTPRIGVNYAGPIWREKLYRFLLLS